jgi:hypothetical protein
MRESQRGYAGCETLTTALSALASKPDKSAAILWAKRVQKDFVGAFAHPPLAPLVCATSFLRQPMLFQAMGRYSELLTDEFAATAHDLPPRIGDRRTCGLQGGDWMPSHERLQAMQNCALPQRPMVSVLARGAHLNAQFGAA